MTGNEHNGWTNYETWRIKLEHFDGDLDGKFDLSPDEFEGAYHLGKDLESHVHNLLYESGAPEYVLNLAFGFLSAVNWREIAERLIDAAKQGEEESA
jgi:hypothetical protein